MVAISAVITNRQKVSDRRQGEGVLSFLMLLRTADGLICAMRTRMSTGRPVRASSGFGRAGSVGAV